jgi:hypothetical protein
MVPAFDRSSHAAEVSRVKLHIHGEHQRIAQYRAEDHDPRNRDQLEQCAPRSEPNITVNVGTTVPEFGAEPVPSALVEVDPRWRGYEYFVHNDEILVEPRMHRIIAILPV